MKTKKLPLVCLALLACLQPLHLRAASITWTNTAGGNWGASNNWSPNFIPGPSDTAYITNVGAYTVTLNTNATVAGLVLGARSGVTSTIQTFANNGQTLTLNGQATVTTNGAFNFASGVLSGAATLSGTMNIQTAMINSSGSLTVSAAGVLNISGTGSVVMEGPLTNNGTVNWLGGNIEVVNDGNVQYKGAIWNQPSGQWLVQCNASLSDNVGTGYEIFNNAGLLCKTNVAGTATFSVYLNNTGGTAQAQVGTVQFNNGCNFAGIFQANAGAAIYFAAANYVWNGTAVFEGPGNVAITGGSVTISAPITSPFAVSGVTLSNVSNLKGSAYLTNITIAGAESIAGTNITCGGLLLQASGSLTVTPSGVLNIVGTTIFNVEGPLTNNGTVNWLSGTVQVVNDNNVLFRGVIWNQAAGKWLIQCNASLSDNVATGYEIFNNSGLLCKTNVAGTTTFSVYLSNTGGTTQAQIGTLQFNNGCNLAGIFQANAGAAIYFASANYVWNGTAVFEGPGIVAITGGSVTISAPITSPFSASGLILSNLSNLKGSAYLTNITIADSESIAGTNIIWDGLMLQASGSLTVTPGGVLNIIGSTTFVVEGPLTNNGTVNWLAGAIQIVNDNNVLYKGVVWNQPAGQWLIQCNASLSDNVGTGYEIFNNAGLLCKTNVAGTTTFSVYLSNTGGTTQAQVGTLQFNNGCNLSGIFQAEAGAAIYFAIANYFWNGTAVFEGPGIVAITGGSVTISAPLTSPFAVSGVILSNVSNLKGSAYLTNITIAGAESIAGTNITWDGLMLQAGASLTVTPSGVLNIAGGSTFVVEGPLTNNGTVNWLGGTIQVVNDDNILYKGVIWNQPVGQWLVQCNGNLSDNVGTGYEIFNNAGLLCKTNVAGTANFSVYLNNTGGTTQAQVGALQFNNGCNLAGIFQAAAGAAIYFASANYVWNGTAVFEGPGNVAITGGSVLISTPLASPFSASGVILSNLSNLKGSAYLTNITIADAESVAGTNITWDGAILQAGASLTVASSGVLNIVGPATFGVDAPLTNNGTVNWLGGTIQVVNDDNVQYRGAIWNQPAGKWFIQCSANLVDDVASGYEVFYNAGLLCKTNVSGSTTFSVGLTNTTGTVDAEIGAMSFANGYNFGAGGTASFGLNSLSSFGTITLSGKASLNGALSVHLNNGYSPAVSNAFALLSYNAVAGNFSSSNLPPGSVWQTVEAPTALTIKVLTSGAPPVRPSLSIILNRPNVLISWTTNSGGFVLNRTPSLASPVAWTSVTNAITVSGTNNTVTVSATGANQYYALIAP